MFPAIEHSELVTILHSHGGDLDATVDYLMALSLHIETEGATNVIHQGLMQAEESYGQFSDEIGGLPSIVPGDQTDSDSDDEEGDAPVNEEVLPSYEEARLRGEGDGYIVAGSIMLPTPAGERQGVLMDGKGVPALKQPRSHKKHSKFLLSKGTLCSLQYFLTYMHDGHKKHNHQYTFLPFSD